MLHLREEQRIRKCVSRGAAAPPATRGISAARLLPRPSPWQWGKTIAMDGARESQDEKGNSLKNLVDKSEVRKSGISFETGSTPFTELEEKGLENPEAVKKGKGVRRAQERPASADVCWRECLLEGRCVGEEEEGPWSVCGAPCCPHSHVFLPAFPFRLRRRCRSSCNFSRATSQNVEKPSGTERDFQKVQRSLRLLGFEPSDFGGLSGRTEATPKRRPRRRSPTLSTKVTRRSVSLESLRAAVRRAWLDDGLDESHRRLLAQAAYEEWYFTKERELREKREEDRIKRLNAKLKLRDDFERKKEKSEEEFQKWLRRKATKRKGCDAAVLQKQEKPFSRLVQTKEKSEKAFLNWKKTKDREMEKIKTEKRQEEEKKMEKEKQKAERKIIAEKAFQQWKTKLEENERKRDAKRQKNKRKQEMEERRIRAEGSQISFQMWKEAKDKQMKEKMKQYREHGRTEREERCAQMEERMYEAEQAFEDWLEQVDLRKEKHCYSVTSYQKTIPWIPV